VPTERRRGIAGTVLVHKIAGAAAASGRSLAEVARLAREAAADLGSMGVALGACTVPAAGRPGFELGADEIELGLGIHGEAGVERTAMMPADALVERLLATIVEDRALKAGDAVALLINGLGGTPTMELAIVARRAMESLRSQGIGVPRAWSGEFLTALEMPGVSLSLLKLDDERLALLDLPTSAPAWPGSGLVENPKIVPTLIQTPSAQAEQGIPDPRLVAALVAVAAALEQSEEHLTDLDNRTGDGDLGASMVRAAEALRVLADESWSDPAALLAATADRLRRAIGGSSGPFYATGLLRMARTLEPTPGPQHWGLAFEAAVVAISDLGGARPGDRTMIDALAPAARAISAMAETNGRLGEILEAAALAAEQGMAATSTMPPRLGRSSYLGDRVLGIPDAGAAAVAIWLRALAQRFG
jgi:dihydroxyacetone kinase